MIIRFIIPWFLHSRHCEAFEKPLWVAKPKQSASWRIASACSTQTQAMLRNDANPIPAPATVRAPKEKKKLHKIYKLTSVIKATVRGSIFKGTYTNRFFTIKHCIIKEGKARMCADEYGRDIRTRLKWQAHVHKVFAAQEFIPKCIYFFEEGGAAYLVLERIHGIPLADYLHKINPRGESWYALNDEAQRKLIRMLLKIISIIDRFHRRKYIHREIATRNFLIDRKGNAYIINAELAWSKVLQKPDPPFLAATPGCIPPEQSTMLTPTEKEDIYGLGTIMITLFTGLDPAQFCGENGDHLAKGLYFLTGSKPIAELIKDCLAPDPEKRPSLATIRDTVARYQQEMEISGYTVYAFQCTNEYSHALQEVIAGAVKGLAALPALQEPGLSEGVAGVLYLLAKLKKNNIDIQACLPAYYQWLACIKTALPATSPGLWKGAAGIALALSEGMAAEFIPDTPAYRDEILQCLRLPSVDTNISMGAAGQGIALTRCRHYIAENTFTALLQNRVDFVIEKKAPPSLSFAHGSTGITWFLLDYITHYTDAKAEAAALQYLHGISKKTNHLHGLFKQKSATTITGDEITGSILTFIKAYEVFKNPAYKVMAERALHLYPKLVLHNNYTLGTGLAGLGELYLEAFRVFGTGEWQLRANWIQNIFLHSRLSLRPGVYYWMTDTGVFPGAGLMTGSGGVLHFLLRGL